MGSTRFRNPWALSSAIAALGTLQPRALGFLNHVDPLASVSNLYLMVDFLHSTVSIVTVKKRPTLCHSTGGTCTTWECSPSSDGSCLLLSWGAPQQSGHDHSCWQYITLSGHPVHAKGNKIGPEVLNHKKIIPPTILHGGTSWWQNVLHTHSFGR